MKKKFAFYFFLVVLNLKGFTQDIIYKTDGNEIRAKVIEIDENYIKYKNYEQLEGPLRNILKSQVFMIKYQDGTEEKYSVVSSTKDSITKQISKPSNGLTSEYIDFQINKALSMRRASEILYGISSLSCLVGLILLSTKNIAIAIPFTVLCGITLFTAIPLGASGKAKYKYWNKKKVEVSFFYTPLQYYSLSPFKCYQTACVGLQIKF